MLVAVEPNAGLLAAPKTFLFGAAAVELPDDPSPLKKPPPLAPVDVAPPPNKLVDPEVLDPKAGAPPNAEPVVDVEPPKIEADEVGAAAELPPNTELEELVVLGVDPNTDDPAEDVAAPPNTEPVEAEVAATGAEPNTDPVEAVVAGPDPKIDPEAADPNGDAVLDGAEPKAGVVDEVDGVAPNTEGAPEAEVFPPNTDDPDPPKTELVVADVVGTAGEEAVIVVVPNTEPEGVVVTAVPKTLAVGAALDPKIDPDEAPDEPNIDPVAFAVEVVVVTAPEAATGFPPKTLLDEDVVVVTVVAPPKTEEAEVPDAGGAVPPNTDPAELVLAIDPNMVEADDDDAPPKTDPDEADVIVGAADPKVDPAVVVVVDADPKAVVDGVVGGFEPNTEVVDVGAALTTEVAGLEEALPKAAVLVAVVDGLVVVTVLFTGLAISVDGPEGAIPNTDDPEEEATVDVAPKIDPALLVIVAGAAPPKMPLEVVVEGVEENPKEGVAELVVLVIVPEASLVLVTAVKALIPKDREADVTAAGAVEVVGGFAPKGEEGPPPPPKLKDPNVEVEPEIGFVAETVEAVGFAILIVEATEAIGLIIADVEGAIDPKALLAANPDVPNAFPKVDETAEGAEATAANGGGGFATEAGAEGGAATGVKLLELETGANPELAPDEVNGLEGVAAASKFKDCLTLFCWPLVSAMTKDLIISLLLGVFKCSPLVLDNCGSGFNLVVPFRSKYCLKAVVFSGENPSTTFFISASGLEFVLLFNLVFSNSEADNFSIVSSSLINSSAPLITCRIFKSLICCSNCCKTVF